MPDSQIRLVCFDLGGVFIRITNDWQETLRRAGIQHFEPPTPHVSDIYRRFEIGLIHQTDFDDQLTAATGWSRAQSHAVLAAVLKDPYPGVDGLLDTLHNRGLQTACLSNTNAYHWSMMLELGPTQLPLGRLHYRFASHLVGSAKPNPAIYEHVEQTTGCPPESILFFDDLPANIDSARRRGWHAHAIDPAGDPIAQAASYLQKQGVI